MAPLLRRMQIKWEVSHFHHLVKDILNILLSNLLA